VLSLFLCFSLSLSLYIYVCVCVYKHIKLYRSMKYYVKIRKCYKVSHLIFPLYASMCMCVYICVYMFVYMYIYARVCIHSKALREKNKMLGIYFGNKNWKYPKSWWKDKHTNYFQRKMNNSKNTHNNGFLICLLHFFYSILFELYNTDIIIHFSPFIHENVIV
jgi:hypothetical protein